MGQQHHVGKRGDRAESVGDAQQIEADHGDGNADDDVHGHAAAQNKEGEQRRHDDVERRDEAGTACGTGIEDAVLLDGAGGEQYDAADDADDHGLPRHFGMATVIPLPSMTVGHSFDSRRRRSCSAMPRRRNHSNGINDSAPNVNRVAPEEQGAHGGHAPHLGYECEAPDRGRQNKAGHAANLFPLHDPLPYGTFFADRKA